jgi:iron-sulfur cluster repair protein YtfE (RIC family)
VSASFTEPHSNDTELDMATAATLDPTLTIKEIVARFPETVPVFRRFGLDTCCGGGVRIEEAAQRDGLDAADVLAAVRQALEGR